jgi:hypothetical protein
MKSLRMRAAGLRLERMKASARWVGDGFRNLHPVLPGPRDPTAPMPTLAEFLPARRPASRAGGAGRQPPEGLVRGGRIVTCGATSGDQPGAHLRRVFICQLQVCGSTLGNPGEFHDLLDAVATNRLEPVVDSRFGLADARDALSRLESERQFGKVVVELPANDH